MLDKTKTIAVHVVNETREPQLISLTIDRVKEGAVMKVPDLRAIMLADALDELTRMQRKYETFTELARVWQEVERVRTQTVKRSAKKHSQAEQRIA